MSDQGYTPLRVPFANMSKEYLNSLFVYKDGKLFWRSDRSNRKIKAGDKAGNIDSRGYWRITLNYKEYPEHRLIFMMHHGYFPKEIDHINNDCLDNRIENLREATRTENSFNRKLFKTNTSGCKNVSWIKSRDKWLVEIKAFGKRHQWWIKDFELAELVAIEARNKFHKEFANHG